MQLLPRAIVGLTGAFGSGCTTAAKYLRDTRGFVPVRLSDSIKAEWSKNHKVDPSRSDLQRLGDELRQKGHSGILVEQALTELEKKNGGMLPEVVVIDGIRNLGEISYLRDVYGFRFTLTAILASAEARWRALALTTLIEALDSVISFPMISEIRTRRRTTASRWNFALIRQTY